MKFIDFFVEQLQQGLSDPRQMREVLYFLIMDQALRSKNLSGRKAWEIIGSLVAFVGKNGKFPDADEMKSFKASINSKHRNLGPRTSRILESLSMFELGELAVKKFLDKSAWKGFPGVDERGNPLE
jgi:hypothetical protein